MNPSSQNVRIMKERYYSLTEAAAIARSYQHLVGQKLMANEEWPIHCVAVAPADRLSKWLFAHIYMDTRNEQEALRFYKKDVYDVILISVCNPLAERVTFLELDEYLRRYMLDYNRNILPDPFGAHAITPSF